MYRHTNLQYRLIESLFRFRWRFIIILLTAMIVTSYLLYQRTKTYMASVSLRVPGNSALNKVLAESMSSDYSSYTPPAKLHAGRFMDLINDNKEGGFMDRVLIRSGLRNMINPLPQVGDSNYEKFVLNTTTSEDSSEVFSIIVRWPNKDQSEKLVGALREEYVEWAGRTKVDATKEALKIVGEDRIKEEKGLLAINKEIQDFGALHSQLMQGQYENDQALNARYQMELGNLQAELQNTVNSRVELEKRRATMEPFVVAGKIQVADPSTVMSGTESGKTASSTYTLLGQAHREKSDLLRQGYIANGPDIEKVEKKIKDLETQIEAEKKENLETPSERVTEERNPDLVFANTQIPNLKIDEMNIRAETKLKQEQIRQMRIKLKEYPGVIASYDSLKKKDDDKQKIVTDLRTKEQTLNTQISVDNNMAKRQFENIGQVYATKTVNNRNLGIFLLGGAFLGFVFGCIAVLVSEISDPSLRYGEDVENGLGVPVLSVVPESRSFQGTELSPEFRWFKLDDLGK